MKLTLLFLQAKRTTYEVACTVLFVHRPWIEIRVTYAAWGWKKWLGSLLGEASLTFTYVTIEDHVSLVYWLLRCIMLQIALCKFLLSRLLQTYTDSTARYHRLMIIIMNWRLSFIEMAFLFDICVLCIFIRIFMTLILLSISRTDRTWLRKRLCSWGCYCGHVACSRFQMPGSKTLQLIGLSFVKSIIVVCQRNLNSFPRWRFF